ncbi:LacI family DNA-binding transcriptional regulator [Paenibacillus terrae]
MKKNQISIKDIARLSGVSVATVSRVINENGRFSEETRQKVNEVIQKYQYETNSIAKSLRMSKSQTIGVLVPDINNEFFSVIVQKTESFLFKQGYSTIICNTAKDAEKEREYLKTLDGKMVDGLICISGQEELSAELLKRPIPIVCIDRRPKINTNVAFIESNHYEGGFLATEELINKGCKNILLLTKQNNLSSVNERLHGYKDALQKHGLYPSEDRLVAVRNDGPTLEAAQAAIERVLEKKLRFDGIFATNDWLALGGLLALQKYGVQVPGEVKIVGFDNDTISKYCNPPLTTIEQDKETLADKACNVLLRMLSGERLEQEQHYSVPVRLIQRSTT